MTQSESEHAAPAGLARLKSVWSKAKTRYPIMLGGIMKVTEVVIAKGLRVAGFENPQEFETWIIETAFQNENSVIDSSYTAVKLLRSVARSVMSRAVKVLQPVRGKPYQSVSQGSSGNWAVGMQSQNPNDVAHDVGFRSEELQNPQPSTLQQKIEAIQALKEAQDNLKVSLKTAEKVNQKDDSAESIAEKQAKHDAEEKAKRDAEEKAKRDAEEKAKHDAEGMATNSVVEPRAAAAVTDALGVPKIADDAACEAEQGAAEGAADCEPAGAGAAAAKGKKQRNKNRKR